MNCFFCSKKVERLGMRCESHRYMNPSGRMYYCGHLTTRSTHCRMYVLQKGGKCHFHVNRVSGDRVSGDRVSGDRVSGDRSSKPSLPEVRSSVSRSSGFCFPGFCSPESDEPSVSVEVDGSQSEAPEGEIELLDFEIHKIIVSRSEKTKFVTYRKVARYFSGSEQTIYSVPITGIEARKFVELGYHLIEKDQSGISEVPKTPKNPLTPTIIPKTPETPKNPLTPTIIPKYPTDPKKLAYLEKKQTGLETIKIGEFLAATFFWEGKTVIVGTFVEGRFSKIIPAALRKILPSEPFKKFVLMESLSEESRSGLREVLFP